jgi:hypothetical protein
MIDPGNRPHIERSEDWAPKRLARADVAAFRKLYVDSMNAFASGAPGAFNGRVLIVLKRDKRSRAMARLGHTQPSCRVTAQWTQERKNGEWGLNVKVHGISVSTGAPLNGGRTERERDGAWVSTLPIGKHRFRKASTQTQFCREVSHLVRLGLGWSRRWSGQ